MEAALRMSDNDYSPYGSATHKQVYIYGGLDPGPTILHRNFGAAFSIGGWLLMACLRKIGSAAEQRLHERVVAELKTTFASHYTKVVSLAEALHLEEIAVYGRRATGGKYLINPNKGFAA
jgi:NADPH2:quinone reductase